jgi:dTDP-4-dehydrorhamnose reductase
MKKKKIYIAGAGGMLGEAFYALLHENHILRCTDIDLNTSWLSYLDFRDYAAYRKEVIDFAPDYLFHLGAYTDLEFCENNEEDTYATNTLAVENAVYIANDLDIPLLYIGTAGIFDGQKEYYDDWDSPNPLGVYARSKYMAERFVVENARKYLVCRAGWMMGGGPEKDKKFIQKILTQIKAGKRELYVVDDKDGTPTYTRDFAVTVMELLSKGYWGVFNTVCSGQTSRLEVARELVRIIGKDSEVQIHPVSSDFFKETYFAVRPASERLVTRKLDLRGLNRMQNWKEALKTYIEQYYQGYLES